MNEGVSDAMKRNPFSTDDSERLTAACLLSAIGGFLDVYTYLFRGGVFANAVTGNIVLLGLQLSRGEWSRCGRYGLAIGFYALGIFAAGLFQWKFPFRKVSWRQTVILLELGCLLAVSLIPPGRWDFVVNSLIAFVCALQVQAFRKVRGLPFASTMCTGNLRSGTEALFRSWRDRDRNARLKAWHYYGVILCFIAGAAGGAVLLSRYGNRAFLLAPAGLLAAFFLIVPRRTLATWRRRFLPRGRRRCQADGNSSASS